jgi:hypothetical protein
MLKIEASLLMNTFLDNKGVDMDNSIAFNMELIAEKNMNETEESWNVYILDEMSFKIYEYYFWNEDLSQWEEVDIIERLKQKSPVKEYVLQWREESL